MGMEIKVELTPEIVKLLTEVTEFKGKWSTGNVLPVAKLNNLKKVATIESVASSTRIEGVKLTDGEVEALLSGLETSSFKNRDEEEVAGYAELMNTIYDSYQDIPLTENYLKQLHGILLKYSSKDAAHLGEYKKLSNNVEAFDSKGKSLGIIFETASPFDTPRLMSELLELINKEFDKNEQHPLLIIAFFIIHLLAIHPFQDGNGRLARALTNLLLLQHDYQYVSYSSLEHIIEENKDSYYRALRKSQKNIRTSKENISEWILFFLKTLVKQKDNLQKKIEMESTIDSLPGLSVKILEVVRSRGRITNSDAVKLFDANRNTVKIHLQRLTNNNYLKKHGQGKGTWYSSRK